MLDSDFNLCFGKRGYIKSINRDTTHTISAAYPYQPNNPVPAICSLKSRLDNVNKNCIHNLANSSHIRRHKEVSQDVYLYSNKELLKLKENYKVVHVKAHD